MVHNELVNALDNQYMENNTIMSEQIQKCRDSGNVLLLQEVKNLIKDSY